MRCSKQTEGSNVAFRIRNYMRQASEDSRLDRRENTFLLTTDFVVSYKMKHTFCKLLGLSCVLSIILMATFWTGKYKT